jgi:hypothetical protein
VPPPTLPEGPFLLLPANRAFLDGKKPRPSFGPGSVTAALGVLALFLGIFALPAFFLAREGLQHAELGRLRRQGQRAEAIVADTHLESGRLGSSCTVVYHFRAPAPGKAGQGDRVDGSEQVAAQFCPMFEDHNPELCTPKGIHPCDRGAVTVLFDPRDPRVNRVDHDRPKGKLWTAAAFSALTGALFVAVAAWLARTWLRQRRLASSGRKIDGVVVAARVSRAKGNKIDLHYGLVTPDGREIEGQVTEFWDHPAGTPPPMPGTPLMVLYVDDRLHKVL